MSDAGPGVGVGGVVLVEGKVLLVRRAKEPLKGRWMVPGGRVERGERLHEALVREIREETGIEVRPGPLLEVLDRVEKVGSEVRFHYVILDYLCEHLGGEPRAGSDTEAVALVAPEDLGAYDLTPAALAVIRKGISVHPERPGS